MAHNQTDELDDVFKRVVAIDNAVRTAIHSAEMQPEYRHILYNKILSYSEPLNGKAGDGIRFEKLGLNDEDIEALRTKTNGAKINGEIEKQQEILAKELINPLKLTYIVTNYWSPITGKRCSTVNYVPYVDRTEAEIHAVLFYFLTFKGASPLREERLFQLVHYVGRKAKRNAPLTVCYDPKKVFGEHCKLPKPKKDNSCVLEEKERIPCNLICMEERSCLCVPLQVGNRILDAFRIRERVRIIREKIKKDENITDESITKVLKSLLLNDTKWRESDNCTEVFEEQAEALLDEYPKTASDLSKCIGVKEWAKAASEYLNSELLGLGESNNKDEQNKPLNAEEMYFMVGSNLIWRKVCKTDVTYIMPVSLVYDTDKTLEDKDNRCILTAGIAGIGKYLKPYEKVLLDSTARSLFTNMLTADIAAKEQITAENYRKRIRNYTISMAHEIRNDVFGTQIGLALSGAKKQLEGFLEKVKEISAVDVSTQGIIDIIERGIKLHGNVDETLNFHQKLAERKPAKLFSMTLVELRESIDNLIYELLPKSSYDDFDSDWLIEHCDCDVSLSVRRSAIFKVVKMLMSNVIKHADPKKKVRLNFRLCRDLAESENCYRLEISVMDYAKEEETRTSGGYGMGIMREVLDINFTDTNPNFGDYKPAIPGKRWSHKVWMKLEKEVSK